MNHFTAIASATAVGLLATTGIAQQNDDAQIEQPQIAQECFETLQSFGLRIQEEGFWLTGMRDRWGTGAWTGTAPGAGVDPYYPGVGAPQPPGTADPAITDGTVQPQVQMWGLGIHSPGVQIETLFRAAQILAIRGDQEGCDAVVEELTDLYQDYVMRLEQAGVDPGQVTHWRQEMLLTAQPVEEMAMGRISADEIIDREVRTPRDEYLGDIEDVMISDRQIEYVVVSHGGFLGLGEDYVVVPWERLDVTPGFGIFVLDTTEAAFENAPELPADVRLLTEAQQQQIDDYWQQTAD